MGIKDSFTKFTEDFKEMIKTKNTDKFTQEYVKPALNKTIELANQTKDFVVENTPKVIDAGKDALDKIKEKIGSSKSPSSSTPNADQNKNQTQTINPAATKVETKTTTQQASNTANPTNTGNTGTGSGNQNPNQPSDKK